jgi:hypothetical protein
LDGIFELEPRGKKKSGVHRRNEPLMEAASGMENLRSLPAMPELAAYVQIQKWRDRLR